ncbi:MAG: RICIN domain-containing protein [Arenicellaceae bacterium]|nr:RICIN domain-containing protein [Arenicellaceae bacterium]
MMRKNKFLRIHFLAGLFAILLASVSVQAANGDLVRLVDPLDEPEFYCLDLSGYGDHLKLEDPLQAHTCKGESPADQLFTAVDGKITVGDTDRCLQVAVSSGEPMAGVSIIARACSSTSYQALNLEANGQIKLGETNLCLAAGTESTAASGPSHIWRVLSVQDCESVESARSTWQVGMK